MLTNAIMTGRFSCIVALTSVVISVIRVDGQPYPSNEYEFSLSRDKLLKAEEKFEHRDASELTMVSTGFFS